MCGTEPTTVVGPAPSSRASVVAALAPVGARAAAVSLARLSAAPCVRPECCLRLSVGADIRDLLRFRHGELRAGSLVAEGPCNGCRVERPALPVGHDDDGTLVHRPREEALRCQLCQRIERRRDQVDVLRRWALEPESGNGRIERRVVSRGEEVRQDAIGEGRKADGDVAELRANGQRGTLRTREPARPRGDRTAAIDRDVSMTTKTSASVRWRTDLSVRTTGCIAARASRPTAPMMRSSRVRRRETGGVGRPRRSRTRDARWPAENKANRGRTARVTSKPAHGVRNAKDDARRLNSPGPSCRHLRRYARFHEGRCSGSVPGVRLCSGVPATRFPGSSWRRRSPDRDAPLW